MIKLIFCLRRLPSFDRREFQDYWFNKHAPLVRRHAATLGIVRYVQAHTLETPALQPVLKARSLSTTPYDGVCEIWYESQEALEAMRFNEEVRPAGRELLHDERQFIDMDHSPIFFAQERQIIGN